MLTLANGDRILMSPAMKAMFEPENLNNASPATVSRAGIIYVSDTELGWEPIAKSWLARRTDAAQVCACAWELALYMRVCPSSLLADHVVLSQPATCVHQTPAHAFLFPMRRM